MKTFFHELDIGRITDMVMIIDIDGTITSDSDFNLSPRASEKIDQLSRQNRVLLLSNKKNHVRGKLLAEKLEVEYIETNHRKPNQKILQDINSLQNRPIVVIGDKFLTDGLFAKSIGAKFIKVKRITSSQENIAKKLVYLIDDILSRIFI